MTKVKACIIMRNEEAQIGNCIKSLKECGVLDIFCLDTGSTDNSRAIAIANGATLFQQEWVNFRVARQFLWDKMDDGDWIIQIDADERLMVYPTTFLRTLEQCDMYEKKSIRVKVTSNVAQVNGECVPTSFDIVRIFKKIPNVKYRYDVHESIVEHYINFPVALETGISIQHMGYEDRQTLVAKMKRNQTYLEAMIARGERDGYILYNLAQCNLTAGGKDEALSNLKGALLQGLRHPELVQKAFADALTLSGKDKENIYWLREWAIKHNDMYQNEDSQWKMVVPDAIANMAVGTMKLRSPVEQDRIYRGLTNFLLKK